MQGVVTKLKNLSKGQPQVLNELRIGHIIEITSEGQAIVDFQSNLDGPIEARSIVNNLPDNISSDIKNYPVLLVFENGDPKLPIIIGFVSETLLPLSNREEVTLSFGKPDKTLIDNKRIVIDAENEIVLRCGKSSVTLKKNGKLVIKGTEISSRAVRANKIKGASVNIN